MIRSPIARAMAATALLSAIVSPAMAANITVKDGAGATQTVCAAAQSDGSLGYCFQYHDSTGAQVDLATKAQATSLVNANGAPTDVAVTAFDATSASEIALLKGIIKTLGGNLTATQPDSYGTGSIAAATANAAYAVAPANGQSTGAITLSGLTASGAVLTAEGSYDGSSYVSIPVTPAGAKTSSTTIAADGQYRFNVGGRRSFRFRVSTVGTGTITATSTLSQATFDPPAPTLDASGNSTVYVGGLRYQLFGTYGGAGQTANATGTAVGPVAPGAYVLSCVGTFGGGTVTAQVRGADGVTFVTVPNVSLTATGSAGIVMPNIVGAPGSGSVTLPNIQAVLSGATSPNLFCSLS